MVVHAAFGGSTNLLLHIPAIAHAAGCDGRRSRIGTAINLQVPRLVDALPNGPVGHPTVQVFLAGGVPEVMLHLRELGLLELDVLTAAGVTLGRSARLVGKERAAQPLAAALLETADGVDPDDVIMSPATARERGLTSTVCFPRGNLAPQGSVVKSTAINPKVLDARRRLSQTRARARFHARSRRHRGHQGQAATGRSSQAMCSCWPVADRSARAWRRFTRSPRRSSISPGDTK